MDHSEHIERIEDGRAAALGANLISTFVATQRENLISSLINLYRAKKLTHDDAVGAIGGLVALDSLMHELQYAQQRGELSAQLEFDNAKE